MKRNGLRIDANFTEDVVGLALESFLTLLSFPRQRFSIEPFSRAKERWLGADARLYGAVQGFRPFYMQFKRPAAYPDYSNSKIIRDRQKAHLSIAPRALYFPLRRKQEKHRDFQHNVLLRLRERLLKQGIGDAAYVCPLFLDRSAYRMNLHWSGLSRWSRFWRHPPWELEDLLLADNGTSILFNHLPVLAEHITVPPHKLVTTASHSYSFTESGSELCFHSPQSLPNGAAPLTKYLSQVAEGFFDRGGKVSSEAANAVLTDLISYIYSESQIGAPSFDTTEDSSIGRWFEWGDHLRTHYAIEQYAMVQWKEGALDFL